MKRILGQVADWSKSGLFKYGGRRGDSLSMFTNGECAMWMNSSAYYGSIESQAKFEYGQSMLPLDTEAASERQNSVIGGATLWVRAVTASATLVARVHVTPCATHFIGELVLRAAATPGRASFAIFNTIVGTTQESRYFVSEV